METRHNATAAPAQAPAWALAMRRLSTWISRDFGGGPRPWKLAWVVNFQKCGTFFFLGALMAWYGNTSTAAWIYLALHGGYGLIWLLKDMTFPDPSWQERVTIGGGINAFLFVLGPYWLFGWLLISGVSKPHYPLPEPMWFCLCITLCLLGAVFMIAADIVSRIIIPGQVLPIGVITALVGAPAFAMILTQKRARA